MISTEIIILCTAAFAAGFIDAVVGGGGLVQAPATFITLPQYPVATLLGTMKIPSFAGTSIAAWQYSRRVSIRWKLLAGMCILAGLAAFAGSLTVSHVSNRFMKPVIFFVLIGVAIYTYTRKNFGIAHHQPPARRQQWIRAGLFAALIGFYDGFIGPGAGSFLVIFFISLLGFDFMAAGAHAKFVNLATNLGSILYFGASGHMLLQFALPMALFNCTGAFLGARMAIIRGNAFIRIFFLAVVTATIIRFGYDIFLK